MEKKLDEKEIERLRDIDIFTIIGEINRGRQIKIRCPFHNDSNPSCVIYPNNSFNCFACGANGQGAIDFVIKLGATFPEAVEELKKL